LRYVFNSEMIQMIQQCCLHDLHWPRDILQTVISYFFIDDVIFHLLNKEYEVYLYD
jgi:hypothetical protein